MLCDEKFFQNYFSNDTADVLGKLTTSAAFDIGGADECLF